MKAKVLKMYVVLNKISIFLIEFMYSTFILFVLEFFHFVTILYNYYFRQELL